MSTTKPNIFDMLKKQADAKKPSESVIKAEPDLPAVAAAPKVNTPITYPYKRPDGDIVLFHREVVLGKAVPKKHVCELVNKREATQVYPYLVDCSCGFQARCYTQDEATAGMNYHLGS